MSTVNTASAFRARPSASVVVNARRYSHAGSISFSVELSVVRPFHRMLFGGIPAPENKAKTAPSGPIISSFQFLTECGAPHLSAITASSSMPSPSGENSAGVTLTDGETSLTGTIQGVSLRSPSAMPADTGTPPVNGTETSGVRARYSRPESLIAPRSPKRAPIELRVFASETASSNEAPASGVSANVCPTGKRQPAETLAPGSSACRSPLSIQR